MSFVLAAALIGFAAGVLSGTFGVGGGVLVLPALRLLLGYPELVAVGTTLPVIIPTAIAGAAIHMRSGGSLPRVGLTVGVWGIPFSVLGALSGPVIGGRAILLIAAVVIVLAAAAVVRPRRSVDAGTRKDRRSGSAGGSLSRFILIGAVTGFYSGLLGLGGGFILVPLLQRFTDIGIKAAIGTSLIAVAVLAVPGAVTHWMLGHVDIPLALALSIGVVPGAVIGARMATAANERGLRLAFALLLALVGATLGLSEIGLL